MIKKELKFANLTFTMQVRHDFQVLRGVISYFYDLFPGSMLNRRPVCSMSPVATRFLMLNEELYFVIQNTHNRTANQTQRMRKLIFTFVNVRIGIKTFFSQLGSVKKHT